MPAPIIWSTSYRPDTIAKCILPPDLKKTFSGIVATGEIPNMILHGTSGVGKTTVARALCRELGIDYMFINASKDGDIDTLRTKIQEFASTVSLVSDIKVVILDEADYLTRATQPALRSFIEGFSNNCRFILTCNFFDKIIDPLQSRCNVISFRSSSKDRPDLAKQFMDSVKEILDSHKIPYDEKVLASVIIDKFPDFRRALNRLQDYANSSGKIDSGILSRVLDSAGVDVLIKYLKDKEFTKMRSWVGVHVSDNEPTKLIRVLYDDLYKTLKKDDIPRAILILAECQFRLAQVADPEIQLVASFTELMLECRFE